MSTKESKDKNPKKLPQDYFEQLTSKVMSQTTADMDMVDLTKDAPLLSVIGKRRGFSHPENYIENLSDRLLSLKNATAETKLIVLYSRIKNLAIASSIALLGGFFIYSNTIAEDEKVISYLDQLEAVEDEVLYAYLEENVDRIDIALLVEYAGEADTKLSTLEDNDLENLWDEEIEELDMIELEKYMELEKFNYEK